MYSLALGSAFISLCLWLSTSAVFREVFFFGAHWCSSLFFFLFLYCVLPIDPNMNWDIDSYKYKCKVLTVVSKSCGTTSQVECFKLCIC